jgi:hypothetical protein
VVEWEINQKIAPTPSVILPLDESESSVPNIVKVLQKQIVYISMFLR